MKTLQILNFCLFNLFAVIGYSQVKEVDMETLSPIKSGGNYNSIQDERMTSFPKFSMGITPSAFLNTCPAIQISADLGVNNGRGNVTAEYGYIFKDNFVGENDSRVADSGFRLKLGYDWMLKNKCISIGGGLLIRHTNSGNLADIEKPGYLETIEYDLERDVTGGYMAFKWHYNISNRFNVRSGFLLGLSNMDVRRSSRDVTDGTLDLITSLWTWGLSDIYQSPGNYTFPLLGFHLNMSYVISK